MLVNGGRSTHGRLVASGECRSGVLPCSLFPDLSLRCYGELSEDEAEIKRTSLATHFYNHLASLEGLGQIIIIENSDPPSDLDKPANIEIFTGRRDSVRFGLFIAKVTLAPTT